VTAEGLTMGGRKLENSEVVTPLVYHNRQWHELRGAEL